MFYLSETLDSVPINFEGCPYRELLMYERLSPVDENHIKDVVNLVY